MIEKAVEFNESNQYLNFIKRLVEGVTNDMKIVDQKAVSTHLTNLIKKREEEAKIAKTKPVATKKGTKVKLNVEDPFDFGAAASTTTFDDDDTFM
jgi:hypothetical protein